MVGLLAPTLLPGLNSAEQQLTPYQLRNASPQQLQRLRQLQELQQRQQRGPGVAELLGSFLPGGQNSILGSGINPQNRLNNQSPGTLAQLLGLSPGQQQPANPNAYLNNNLNNQARPNVYGQPTPNQQTPNANLRTANDQTNSNDSNDNSNDNSTDSNENGEDNGDENSEDNSGNESGGENQSNQPDPSQDPDMQQFQNMQGNDNFPGDLFPTGILSEGDLKDIQKSMEEQQKKEAERQKQQEAEQGNGGEGDANTEGENSGDNSENNDQSGDDQSNENAGTDDEGATNEENANQTDDAQDNETNSNLKTNNGNDLAKDLSNNGKLNANDDKNSGYIANNKKDAVSNLNNLNGLNNKLPVNKPTGYSYNNLRPNNYKNVNSNVQYEEDDRNLLNNNANNINNLNRQSGYSNMNDLPINRYNNNQRGSSYNQDDYTNRMNNRPLSRFNDFGNRNRFGNRLNGESPLNDYNRGLSNDPYASPPYNSQVDYTPEYNQDRFSPDAGLYNNPNSNSDSYNPMSNYRPNQLLGNHLNRQHGDINNFNYRNQLSNGLNRLNRPNYLNNRNLDRNSLGNERSAVNYEPE